MQLFLGFTVPSGTLGPITSGTRVCKFDLSYVFLFGLSSRSFTFLHSPSGAKQGLLIRGGDVLERLAGIDYITLDKVSIQAYSILCLICFYFNRLL